MDKTIENKFFELFKEGGVVDNCIQWVRYKYQLPIVPSGKSEMKSKAFDSICFQKENDEKWAELLHNKIMGTKDCFSGLGLYKKDSPLLNEIEANLNECRNDLEKERYAFSLLQDFGTVWGCGFSEIFSSTGEINSLNKDIKMFEDNGCDMGIEDSAELIEWIIYVNSRFWEIIQTGRQQEGSIEWFLWRIVGVVDRFANRLDAVLLTFGIDLLRLQRECGIYIKTGRMAVELASFLGSKELAQRYIDALPKETPRNERQKVTKTLPSEFDSEEGKRWLEELKKAGYLDGNFQLTKKVKTKAQTALLAELLLEKVGLCRKFKILEVFWGVKGLSKQRYNSRELVGKVQGGEEIEELFK